MAVQALPPVLKGISLFLQKIIWVWYEISVQKVHTGGSCLMLLLGPGKKSH